ncbi:MAG: hypothetical protein mread185_000154 [Mycoplasmataceae bacterium]|nr:MAG: hypothetical protein mread185_000154 [Mycoplasmataceae bacterium]
MPFFIFAPVLIAVEVLEVVQAAVVVGAAVVGARAAVQTTNAVLETTGNLITDLTTTTSSSSSATTCFEQKTIYDWWCNGLESYEREILLENGYSDRSGCFSLEELKIRVERLFADKAPGKPTEKDGYVPDRQKGEKLVKNPNGKGKGWLDKKGNVWVPNDKGHGGPNWEVQAPNGDHWHVYPDGKVRTH